MLPKNPGFGLVVAPDVVVPRSFAERMEAGVAMTHDGHYCTAGFAFAACKALGLREPSHRKDRVRAAGAQVRP